ncbi:hypothetical protein CAOG_02911 [Capsaspora owczarzaki ATCC 30864]|uniref:hypothetical protein n=1 Tax=Capsaspora owczarzaki (strain ATCC 30864) TaxID=595528 RepID=UPI0001FE2E67|nr:hypothetical protein CAOG_02911 [Capsaspora owczarzaki ATCC 30864]|eukprot:XP_004363750.1 hypothetical protein CAOG_02911 [Capsaspora owczarzaki ATCC 30864]
MSPTGARAVLIAAAVLFVSIGSVAAHNGCGSSGALGAFIPDANVRDLCNKHDDCYSTCGVSKETCDGQFLAALKSKCKLSGTWLSKTWDAATYPLCMARAITYYEGVAQLGHEAFKTAREKCSADTVNRATTVHGTMYGGHKYAADWGDGEKGAIPSGWRLVSQSGKLVMLVQEDGNVVIYGPGNTALWSTRTNGHGQGPFRLVMQDDCNLVLRDKNNLATWTSDTAGKGVYPCTIELYDDGPVIIGQGNVPVWRGATLKL